MLDELGRLGYGEVDLEHAEAITGTIFGSTLIEELPRKLAAGGVPVEVGGAIAGAEG